MRHWSLNESLSIEYDPLQNNKTAFGAQKPVSPCISFLLVSILSSSGIVNAAVLPANHAEVLHHAYLLT